jgi:hypothetical protein
VDEGTGYQINQSLRFDGSSHLSLAATGSGGSSNFTLSVWVKLTKNTGANGCIFGGSGYAANAQGLFLGDGNSKLNVAYNWGIDGTGQISNALFRDPSAWYHLVMKVAGTNLDLYINNEEVSLSQDQSYSTNNFNSSSVARLIGAVATNSPSDKLNGYLAEFHFVDGSSLTPSSFGETDTITGAWIPKKYSGSYGTNGYYLKFDPSATNGIGHDHSGNGNHFTATGFTTSGTGTDVMSDTPTTNYATFNPVDPSAAPLSEGNLKVTGTGSSWSHRRSTFAMTSGKWYWENTVSFVNYTISGVVKPEAAFNNHVGQDSNGWGFQTDNGKIYNNSSGTSYGSAITTGTVLGFAFDADTGKMWVRNASGYYNSGDPVAGTNPAMTAGAGTYFAAGSGYQTTEQNTFNFGQTSFSYTPPTGYKALNTANLPEPTIKKGSKYFDVLTWSGTGGGSGATRSLTGLGFSPDFVWGKIRTSSSPGHILMDAVRGVGTGKYLQSNTTNAEGTSGPNEALYGYLSSLDSAGFTVTNGTSTFDNWNKSGDTYVAWAWDANGAGSSNTAGTITSTVSANASAGFSIVTFTGNGSTATVGHGLGVAPRLVIVKKRAGGTMGGGYSDWLVYSQAAVDAGAGSDAFYYLNSTAATSNSSSVFSGAPSSTVINIGNNQIINNSGSTFVAYCFSEVAGYSKFGSYTGNGSSDGPFVFLGFRPKLLIWKRTDSSANWFILDAARSTYNVVDKEMYPDQSAAESTFTDVDFLSNGFKLRASAADRNGSGATFIYAAWAELPAKYSNAR